LLRYYEIDEFDNFLEPFLNGTIDRYQTWQDHVSSYLDSPLAKNGNLFILRFEDLRKDPEEHLRRIVEFLGVRSGQEDIRRAIAHNTVEKMRAKEDASSDNAEELWRRGTFRAPWLGRRMARKVDRRAGAFGRSICGRVLGLMGYPTGVPVANTTNDVGIGRAEESFGPPISSNA
jgi:hypothetical protein